MRTIARVTLAALALCAGRAGAEEDACRADAERLCAGIPPGGGRTAACLRAHADQVSAPCKAQLASFMRKVKEVGQACEGDIESTCPDVRPGQGAVLRCLRQSFYSLAPGCQDAVRGASEKLAEFKKACGPDAKRHCKGIAPGQGRILACLKSKEPELAPACQALMK
jgi:hypothetical protein